MSKIFNYNNPIIDCYKITNDTDKLYSFNTETNLYYVSFSTNNNVAMINISFKNIQINHERIFKFYSTVLEIINIFHSKHLNISKYVFNGLHKKDEDFKQPSIQSKLYFRYGERYLSTDWNVELRGNKVIVRKL